MYALWRGINLFVPKTKQTKPALCFLLFAWAVCPFHEFSGLFLVSFWYITHSLWRLSLWGNCWIDLQILHFIPLGYPLSFPFRGGFPKSVVSCPRIPGSYGWLQDDSHSKYLGPDLQIMWLQSSRHHWPSITSLLEVNKRDQCPHKPSPCGFDRRHSTQGHAGLWIAVSASFWS
jgi:hypothetical protein